MSAGKVNVVTAVLSALVLAALIFCLMPVTTGHGEPARLTRCLSNVKQLALGTIIYAGDWDDRLPNRDTWMDSIYEYHKNKGNERCPAVEDESNSNPQLFGYAFNSELSFRKTETVESPTDDPMLYDSINLARSASDPLASLPSPPRMHRKRRGNQIGFVDGHARRQREGEFFVNQKEVGP